MRIILFLILMSGVVLVSAQSKEDFINILEALAEDAQADPLFQVELPEGRTMVLIRNIQRRNTQSSRDAEQIFYDVLNEDLTFTAKPIRILSQEEAQQLGVDLRYCTQIGFRISEEQADLMLSTTLEGEHELFQGAFTFRKDFSGWEITGRNIRSR